MLKSFNRRVPIKLFNCEATTRSKLRLLYWNHWRSDQGRIEGVRRKADG